MLQISLLLQEMLQEEGAEVMMTRTEDENVQLYRRPTKISEHGADFFISVHTNAHVQSAAAADLHGIMTVTVYDYDHN